MPRKHRKITIEASNWLQIQTLAETARAGHIYLLSGPRQLSGYMSQELIDMLAMRGAVYVIAGGNRYSLARLPLLLSNQPQVLEAALQRIQITRAETPHQLLDALENTGPQQCPLVVSDLLANLNDEDILESEAERLLGECLHHLERLSAQEAVLVSVATPAERPRLLAKLRVHASDEVRLLLGAPETDRQPALLER